jgi:hypothetical protein
LQVNSGATAPEWVSPAAGGAFTLLSTTTLSGASVTVSAISQDYTDLYVLVDRFLPATNNVTLRMRVNGDTGNNYAGRAPVSTDQASIVTYESSTRMAADVRNAAEERNSANIYFYNYANTTTHKGWIQDCQYANQSVSPDQFGWSNAWNQWKDISAITSSTIYKDNA